MRWLLAIATAAAIAAFALGMVAPGAPPRAVAIADDRGAVGGVLFWRAEAIRPARGHPGALRAAFGRAHDVPTASRPLPGRLLEATAGGVLWALATFALPNGTAVVERFSWRHGAGWRDLGP